MQQLVTANFILVHPKCAVSATYFMPVLMCQPYFGFKEEIYALKTIINYLKMRKF